MTAGTFVAVLALGIGGFWLIKRSVYTKGRALRSKFQAAGTLKGKTKAEIIALVGPPTFTSAVEEGSVVMWRADGYNIRLGFDLNGNCVGVQSEYIDPEVRK
jgi:hypothetical protein